MAAIMCQTDRKGLSIGGDFGDLSQDVRAA
jgi:hypothetical protein